MTTVLQARGCERHLAESDPECGLCDRERECAALAQRWINGAEPIPLMANTRALEILEWAILRRELVAGGPRAVQAMICMRLSELTDAIESLGGILERRPPRD